MKKPPFPWVKLAVMITELLLAVAAIAAPLVFSSAVLANFLAVLEVIAKSS
jgi:hypothetical protein